MIDKEPVVDRLAEINMEVKSMVGVAVSRWSSGEELEDIVKDPAIRSALDYLISVEIKGSDSPDMPPHIQAQIDEAGTQWQQELSFIGPEEQDALALHMLKGLVSISVIDQIE